MWYKLGLPSNKRMGSATRASVPLGQKFMQLPSKTFTLSWYKLRSTRGTNRFYVLYYVLLRLQQANLNRLVGTWYKLGLGSNKLAPKG